MCTEEGNKQLGAALAVSHAEESRCQIGTDLQVQLCQHVNVCLQGQRSQMPAAATNQTVGSTFIFIDLAEAIVMHKS